MQGWEKTKIGEFLFERKGRYKPDNKEIAGLKRIEKIDFSGSFHIAHKPSKTNMILIKHGDLVISGINVAKGAMGIYQGKADVTATIHYSSYTFDKSKIDVDYFKRFLKSTEFIRLLQEQVKGGIKTEIKPKHILPLEIELPNLDKQKEIVQHLKKIETDDSELKTELTYQQILIKKLRQQILQEAIEGKLTEDWRMQNPNVKPASELLARIQAEKDQLIKDKKSKKQKPLLPITDEEKLFVLPEGWVWCRLGEIADIKVGATPARENPEYWGGDVNWVSSGEVANNYISSTKETITTRGVNESSAKISPKGSVLVAMIGQGKTRGQTAILEINAATNQNVAAIRLPNQIVPELIWYFFLSRYELTRRGASGGNQPALNGIKIKNTVFALPPAKETKEIIIRLKKIESIIEQLENKINQNQTHTEQLMQAVLKEAFQQDKKADTNVIPFPAMQDEEERSFLKRKILAAYIINQSLDDTKFGHTKFEKLLHLSEYHTLQRNFNQQYQQKAAGPYDNKFTRSFFAQTLKANWFVEKQFGSLKRIMAGENIEKSQKIYNYFTQEELDKINHLIQIFKDWNYEIPEIVSTLYAVWNNRLIRGEEVNDELLKQDFLSWDEQKSKYKDRLDKALDWMREKEIIPNGWGKLIEKL